MIGLALVGLTVLIVGVMLAGKGLVLGVGLAIAGGSFLGALMGVAVGVAVQQ